MAPRNLFLLVFATLLAPVFAFGDSIESAVKSVSPFKDFSLNQVSGGQILESRTGATAAPQIEAVQTCFLVKAPPSTVVAQILSWNPAGKSGLDVSKHFKLTAPVNAGTFSGPLAAMFKSGDGKWIEEQSKKAKESSCELLLTASEKSHLAAAPTSDKLTSAWASILASRFNEKGGGDFKKLEEIIGKYGAGAISGTGSLAYWEIGDVSDRGTISEATSWNDGEHRVLDGEFFVTSEYSASLNVSTLWPVTVNGKPATIVWRIDSAYADQFADQSGAERIASAGLILSSTKQTIEAMRHELEK